MQHDLNAIRNPNDEAAAWRRISHTAAEAAIACGAKRTDVVKATGLHGINQSGTRVRSKPLNYYLERINSDSRKLRAPTLPLIPQSASAEFLLNKDQQKYFADYFLRSAVWANTMRAELEKASHIRSRLKPLHRARKLCAEMQDIKSALMGSQDKQGLIKEIYRKSHLFYHTSWRSSPKLTEKLRIDLDVTRETILKCETLANACLKELKSIDGTSAATRNSMISHPRSGELLSQAEEVATQILQQGFRMRKEIAKMEQQLTQAAYK
ncbi:hypothetical protein PP404_06335 [Mycobacteroides abscessus]|nr:hypothetical protein [Mycobacteroides abscessus]MDM2176016.1 hypothetical protein [Mycobacteroides abscessus]MDM2207086.1 hypothetical protein [Mycobacteroides abscessus]MDM2210180.1 hypothetical protein [Mycobacteroides abscessus]MDM2217362.1 hypothetical protein [Mycobacteroides abscessus]